MIFTGYMFVTEFSNGSINENLVRIILDIIPLLLSVSILIYFSPFTRNMNFYPIDFNRIDYFYQKYFTLMIINIFINLILFVTALIIEIKVGGLNSYIFFICFLMNIITLYQIQGITILEFIGMLMILFSSFALEFIEDFSWSNYCFTLVYIIFFFIVWISGYLIPWNIPEN